MAATTADQQQSQQPTGTPGNPLDDQTIRWFLGWGVLLAILLMIGRTKTGYAAIYYSLTLLIFLLFVTQYQWIADALKATQLAPPSEAGSGQVSRSGVVQLAAFTINPISTTSPYLSPGGVIHPL